MRGSPGRRFRALVDSLSGPAGGTEIGKAIEATIAQTPARDIVIITDGKSHALDVQALAQKGRRISVILVGEDSLEANIGHLAALTGGDIFVSGGADLVELFQSAMDTVRVQSGHAGNDDAPSGAKTFQRAGLMAKLSFGLASEVPKNEISRAVAAIAAPGPRALASALRNSASPQAPTCAGRSLAKPSLMTVTG